MLDFRWRSEEMIDFHWRNNRFCPECEEMNNEVKKISISNLLRQELAVESHTARIEVVICLVGTRKVSV